MISNFIDIERANRLREERKRIGDLTQIQAAEIAQVKENSWVRFEKRGEPFDLKVVTLLQNYGFDMIYVIFGVRVSTQMKIEPEQHELLRMYADIKPDQRAGLMLLIRTFAAAHSAG